MNAKILQHPLLALAFLLYAPAARAEPSEHVVSSASIESWVETVNRRLDRAMSTASDVEGSVVATFRRADDGHAVDVRILAESRPLRDAMRAALHKLGRLPPLPDGIAPQQLIRAQLLFGGGMAYNSYEMRRRRMLGSAADSNRKLMLQAGRAIAQFSMP